MRAVNYFKYCLSVVLQRSGKHSGTLAFCFGVFSILITFFFMAVNALPAQAHWADMAAMELNVSGAHADATLSLPSQFLAAADSNKDGKLSNAEIKANQQLISQLLSKEIFLKADGKPGELSVMPSESHGFSVSGVNSQTTLQLSWKWEKPGNNYLLHYSLFPPDALNAHCLVSASLNQQVRNLVFNHNMTEVPLTEVSLAGNILQFIFMGIEHIDTGYDHILFLVALILAGGGFMYLIRIITAFTLAHSITLSLAVLGIVSVPSRLVESCIAASIIYVAAENLWRRKDEASWILVFIFGLVHGLGFANVLKEMELPRNQLIQSLVSFNLGIELGQLVIVLASWFLLSKITRLEWAKNLKPAGSVAIMMMASFWFFQRAFLGI